MNKDFLTLSDASADELLALIARARYFKSTTESHQPLKGKYLGLIFEKESTRTRISFEVAMKKLGGDVLYLGENTSQLSRGESHADTARVLSRYLDCLVLRTYSHDLLLEMARNADIPVINGLTDLHHPCQVLSDLMTLSEKKGTLKGLTVAYVGDGHNMANSWIQAAQILGFPLRVACPKKYFPNKDLAAEVAGSSSIQILTDPVKAVTGVDVVNTDTWFSMGQKVSAVKKSAFKPFQLNAKLLKYAKPSAIVLHCLPAHRGEEITDEVMDGPQSVIFDQAENRLYVQMALLEKLLVARGS